MKKKMILSASFLAATTIFSSWLFAAESAPASAQPQQGMVASEHSGHAGMAGMMGMGGMGKPMAWTSFPTLKTRMGGESRERMVITVVPQNIVANSIDAYSNDIKGADIHRQLPLGMAGAKLDQPKAGGFHWLSAREELADKVLVASTVYYFSNPGKNPTAMFMQQKHELEIIPQPFPREHSRYRSNEERKFLVRFNSQPLANQKVNLETQNGTKTELVSDAQGVITVHLPDDFKAETGEKTAGGRNRGRRSADFVLAVEHAEGGKTYLTGFNSSYGPDAFDQRSIAMGLGFTLLGMIGAVPLLRQRKPSKQPDANQPADTNKSEEA
jgi:hypothetical protein